MYSVRNQICIVHRLSINTHRKKPKHTSFSPLVATKAAAGAGVVVLQYTNLSFTFTCQTLALTLHAVAMWRRRPSKSHKMLLSNVVQQLYFNWDNRSTQSTTKKGTDRSIQIETQRYLQYVILARRTKLHDVTVRFQTQFSVCRLRLNRESQTSF